jgi:hypothetical protein
MDPARGRLLAELADECELLWRECRKARWRGERRPPEEARLQRASVHADLALAALAAERRESEERLPRRLRTAAPEIARQLMARRSVAPAPGLRNRRTGAGELHARGSAIGIPDFLGFLQIHGKTGLLRAGLPHETIEIYVDRGDLVHAESDATPEGQRLGDLLVARGAIERAELERFLDDPGQEGERIGRALERGELIDPGELEAALAQQILNLFLRLIETTDSSFLFLEGVRLGDADARRWSVVSLLLESQRRRLERGPQP